MRRLSTALGWAWAVVRSLSTTLFGRVAWEAPSWVSWCGRAIGLARARLAARPRLTAGVAVASVALAAGGFWGYLWWQSPPRPVVGTFTANAPERTQIDQNKKPNPLIVTFHRSAAPIASVGKEVASGIAMSPALAGTWRWTSDRTLTFKPADDWPVGTLHTVTFDKRVVARDVRLAEYQLPFRTPAFVMTAAGAEFYQDPVDAAMKKAVIALSFSHPVNTAELEKRIELRLAGQSAGILGVGRQTTKFTITYDKLKLNASVHSAPLPAPKEETSLIVTVDRGVISARGGRPTEEALTQTVDIPGLYILRVGSVGAAVVSNSANEAGQVLVVALSATVYEKEIQKKVSAWVMHVLYQDHPRAPRERH